ncbi:MAG: tetratricopeptide repeat protein [Flavobacteriales bacterium]|nr:tetratricopeptide repeat protein [Flavobacteriales bacterium]
MNWLDKKYAMFIVVAICSFLQFSNTLSHDYAWDDKIVILDNPDVKAGIAGLGEIWHKQHSDYLHDQLGYRPIVLTTFALEQEFFPMNPKIGHLMNVVYFSLLCMVILLFLQEVVPQSWQFEAFLVTILFLVHPLHVEVVANIKSRDEIFQLLFSLLSILFYWKWFEAKKWWFLVGSALFFIVAILSRENAIVTVGLIPLTILLFGTGTFIQRLKRLLPAAAFALIGVMILALSLSGDIGKAETAGMGIVYEDSDLGNGLFYNGLYGLKRYLNFNLVMLRYFKNFFWPVDLAYYYGYNHLKLYEIKDAASIIGAIATAFLTLITLVSIKFRRIFAYGALFFFIAIFPFLQFVNYMNDTMADRFVFGPSLGLCLASVSGVGWMLEKLFKNAEQLRRTVAWALIISVLGFYSFQTFQRNKAWKNNYTLFSTDIVKLEDCAKAHEHYADVLHEKYLRTNDASLIPEITYHYQASIEISDRSYYSFIKLGSNYASFGNPEMGIQVLRKAVELFSDKADPNFYLGSALFRQKQYAEAIPYFKKGVEYSPKISDSHELLIRSYEAVGILDSALLVASNAVVIFPQDIKIRDAICDVYFGMKNYDVAFAHADTLLDLAGLNSVYWKKAIGIRQLAGRDVEANALYRKGLEKGVSFDN